MERRLPQRIRGTILQPQPDGGVDCLASGEISIGSDGTILECGDRHRRGSANTGGELVEFEVPVLIVPGLVDAHVHLSQFEVRGQRQGPLLPWLEELIFPTELSFADPEHAARATRDFERTLLALGTTAAGVYVTAHGRATRIALERLRLKGLVGKVLMDRAGPEGLLEEVGAALADLERLITEYGDRAAITPRFAVSCSAELLAAAGRLASRTGSPVMTHLAENADEVASVARLFPEAVSYTEVYDRAGLLGDRTLVAHAIHLADTEFELLAARGVTVVHCPTANAALGSGRMAVEQLRRHGVPYVLGSDVGAGPSLSMWHVIAGFLAIHAGHASVSPEEAFWRATLGGRRALGLPAVRSLVPGERADLAVFARPPGPAEAGRLIRAMAEATAAQPEPRALATWLDGRLVHRTDPAT